MPDGEGRRTTTVRGWLSLVAVALLAATLPPLLAATLPVLSPRYSATVVASGSMAPAIRTGDVVVTRVPAPGTELSPPAVVLHRPVGSDRLVLHRVVAVGEDGRYVTRGDANRSLDAPVPAERIVGVGALAVPLIGTPLLWSDEGRYLELLLLFAGTAAAVHLARTPGGGRDRTGRRLRLPAASGRLRRPLAAGVLAAVIAVAALLGPGGAIDRSAAAYAATADHTDNNLRAADRTPPTVILDDPGRSLIDTVTLTASASDAHSTVDTVAVEYAPMDSEAWEPACTSSQQPWSCDFDTSVAPPGGYLLRAIASDVSGNTTTSASVETAFGMPTFGGIGPATGATSSGAVTVAYPPGTQPGDLVLLVQMNAANQTSVPPTGWDLIVDAHSSGNFRYGLWWALAGTETSVDVQAQTDASGVSLWVVRYAVTAGRAPVAYEPTLFVGGTPAASATFTPTPDVTTTGPATVIQLTAVRAPNDLSLTVPRDFSHRGPGASEVGGGSARLGVADATVPRAATPASPTWAQTGTPAPWAWGTLVFR